MACAIAMRRLRSAGLTPLPYARSGSSRVENWLELDRVYGTAFAGTRLAAALVIPISQPAVNCIFQMVTRGKEALDVQAPAAADI